ncbi:phytoene desaturase family protein [Nocardioides speluncae]|uniref:phytoene desaturase family protein n=1 Tax=Nocardioides speluncae TaxID=2670337 RepID=UPI000D69642A|nr:FAD-dependent oxidoreductase [Nocardioides speluncae]
MARVVVVGGGYGGLATAARLAKLGHEVTLVERNPQLGGALSFVEQDGFRWDAGPTTTMLPAAVRDLFRKTGRPLDKEIELVWQEVLREHRFEDGSSVALPGGTRAAQLEAVDELGAGLGQEWIDYVAGYADDWELLRRDYLERPWDRDVAPKATTALLTGREMMHKRLKRTLKDERLRLMAGFPFLLDGHELRNVPAWLGVTAYVEQNFGAWTVPGGMARLTAVLGDRLATRKVEVLLSTTAEDVVLRDGRAVAVRTHDGDLDADIVVSAIDPRRLPALVRHVDRTMPAIPPVISYLGLSGDVPELGPEVVFHGDPTLVVRTGGQAPAGGTAWTVLGRGKLAEDIVVALARKKIDIREQVEIRIDRSPRDLVEEWGGSPLGVLWQGRGTVRHRLGPTTPIPNVYAAGAHATPGSGLPFVGLSAALVAQAVGPA